jgi:hypothetical protein
LFVGSWLVFFLTVEVSIALDGARIRKAFGYEPALNGFKKKHIASRKIPWRKSLTAKSEQEGRR